MGEVDAIEALTDSGRPGSTILRVLAEAPATVLEEELRRLEQEQLEHPDHLAADYYATVRVRELVERRRRRERELSVLYATVRSLTGLRGVDDALTSIVGNAHELIGADITYLAVLENGTHLRIRASVGHLSPGFDKDVYASANIGVAGRVASSRAPYCVSDYISSTEVTHDPDVDRALQAEGIVSMLGVPLVVGDRFLGTLIAAHRVERPFTRDEVALLCAFADHAAVALENARLYEESQRALHDLTKAYATIEAAGVVHEALTRVVLAGGDMGAVADVLVNALGGSVLVLDRVNRVVAARGQPVDDADRAIRQHSTLTAAKHLAAPLAQCIDDSRRSGHCASVGIDDLDSGRRSVAAVVAGSTHLGALIFSRHGDLEPVELRTLERAAQITALLILTQDALVRAEERVRGELLTQLFVSQRPFSLELNLRARERHIELEGLDAVLVIETDEHPNDVVRVLHGPAERYRGLAGEHLGIPTALIHTDDVASTARHVHDQLRRTLEKPVVVCAAPTLPDEPFGRAFALATRCCRVLRELGIRDGDATTEELAMYAILFDPERGQDLSMFLDRTLGKIVEHDAKRGTDLTGTLSAYFAQSSNITHTARALRIHTNTLLKRMDRVGSILGRDWQQPHSILKVQLAVHLHDLAQRTRVRPNSTTGNG